MKPHDYRDLIASYIDANFGARGITVYTEVSFGKTIIGKNRQIDVFVLRRADQKALALECKYQQVSGTTDEKIPYALLDLEALWIPGCLVYAGEGWSEGVLHTLQGHRLVVEPLDSAVEVIYLQPEASAGDRCIDFALFAEHVRRHPDPFSARFAEHLLAWRTAAGAREPA